MDHVACRAARRRALVSIVAFAATLAACGGGGGGEPTPPTEPLATAQQCAPSNPYRADALAATTTGDLASEKRWLLSYMRDAYLWYREIPGIDANAAAYSDNADTYGSLDRYFEALKTPALTASGKRKDDFSFTYPTRAWTDLAQSGAVLGYGIEWHFDAPTPPRGIRIAYVEPGSVAANAGLARGDILVSADGIAADINSDAGVAILNEALFPSVASAHGFVFSRDGATQPARTLSAGTVVKQPVLMTRVLDVGAQKVGYIVFNDHFGAAETQLANAIETLRAAHVSDLVLDLRYNGGGYLYIASQLAYMIAGPARTHGRTFERALFNDKRSAESNASALPFIGSACMPDANFDCTSNAPLPTLDLPRVTILAGGSTCSASESIINGLRGIDIEVRIVGERSCGKPYAFSGQDNCGISYFPIEFQGVNDKGSGDYADGFAPGCAAADDFSRELGDIAEGRLAAALYLQANGVCPPLARREATAQVRPGAGVMQRGPARENRIVMPRRR